MLICFNDSTKELHVLSFFELLAEYKHIHKYAYTHIFKLRSFFSNLILASMYTFVARAATVLMSIGSDSWYLLSTQLSLRWGDCEAVDLDPEASMAAHTTEENYESPALMFTTERTRNLV